jgi:hypothetical protein
VNPCPILTDRRGAVAWLTGHVGVGLGTLGPRARSGISAEKKQVSIGTVSVLAAGGVGTRASKAFILLASPTGFEPVLPP